MAERTKALDVTHIITSDLKRTRRTAEIIADVCGCEITLEPRLRELDMGVLERRHFDSLIEEEESWRRQLVNGTADDLIPDGESMQKLSERMHAAQGCLVSIILGLPAYAGRRLRLRNCSISRIDYQQSPWLASGWVVKPQATSRIWTPLRLMRCSVNGG